MTTEQLNNVIKDSIVTRQYETAVSAYKDYLIGRCHHPKKILIYDTMINQQREIEVPCGKCLHCRETKVTEWVQRLYAHSEHYKYIYFTTLTYAPFEKSDALSTYIVHQLSDALWLLCDHNSTGRLAYHPTLLVKRHYQLFLKRLRSYLSPDSELSYLVCGEYGKKYARPHFHFILFSQCLIPAFVIARAWSISYHINSKGTPVRLTSQSDDNHAYTIGNISHDDLKANGNFDNAKSVNVDGRQMSAKNCFAYVCKYMLKDTANYSNVNFAYDSMFGRLNRQNYTFQREFNLELKRTMVTQEASLLDVAPLDRNLFHPSTFFSTRINITDYNPLYYEFKNKFAPFVECSRGTPIGSLFLHAHLQEYQNGNFVKPRFYEGTYNITPSYFLRKVSQSLFSLDRVVPTESGNIAYNKVSYLDLRKDLLERSFGSDFKYLYDYACKVPLSQALTDPHNLVYQDKFRCVKYLIGIDEDHILVNGYSFDRSSRKYVHVESYDLSEFIAIQLDRLNVFYTRYYDTQRSIEREKAQCIETTNIFMEYASARHGYDLSKPKQYCKALKYFSDLTSKLRVQIVNDYYDYVTKHTTINKIL